MEISGIGGYRDGLAARSSVTSGSTAAAGRSGNKITSNPPERPPATRSVSGAVYASGVGGGGEGRLLQGGHRASEPILLDFDLPSPASARRHQQHLLKQQQYLRRNAGSAGSASSTRSKRKTQPRLDNLTPVVTISEEAKAAYKQAAEDRIARTLLKSQAAWDGTSGIFDDPKDWKLHTTKPNLSMYRPRKGAGSDESISTYRPFVATGRIPGLTLQDVEYGLYAETTPDERAVNAFWFSDYFLDAAVLDAYETQTEEDPFHFFGMKWLLTGSIGGVKIISPRDNAFLQYTKTVKNELGEKILVKVVESMPEDVIPFIPDQGDLHFVRSELSIIYMYHYDPKAKEVQVFCEGKIDPAGRTPSWMANVNLSLFAPIIVQLENIADAKYITKHGLMFPHNNSPSTQSTIAPSVSTHLPSPMASSLVDSKSSQPLAAWVPNHQRKACFVCFKSFSVLRRHRHHCRMCGEVMCSQCMVTLPLVAPPQFDADKDENFPLQNQPESKKLEDSNRHGFPVVNLFKLCKKCIFAIRQERRAMVAGVSNYYFTEGMMRHHAQMQAAFAGNYDNQFADEGECDDSGYLDSFEEDESIIDDVQYSKRIEKLRQEHMEREKQKLRDQQRNHHSRVSVKLFDESAVSLPSSESASRKQSDGSSSGGTYDFENLVMTEQKPPTGMTRGELLKSKSDSDRFSTKSGSVDNSASASKVLSASAVVPSNSSSNNNMIDSGDATRGSSLLPIDIRRRSFSIPDHFEKMERSIAEQEALISSIQEARAKTKAQPGSDAAQSRLPIGAVMRSIAQTNSSVMKVAQGSDGGSNQRNENESAQSTSLSTESQSPPQC